MLSTQSPARRLPDLGPLARAFRGDLLTPGHADYDAQRRIWNAMIDRRPALIARCANTADVVAAVRFATEHALSVSVRGGGHNAAGSALAGDVVVDLSPMRRVDVDTATRRVRVQGGATIGDVDRATVPHGLAVPLGAVTETGIAGLTLGGGYGWQTRKHGLACDALRAAEVVTADGAVLDVSADTHADLFWGLRGGGGNFGVVTRFEYEAYPVAQEVFMLAAFYPISAAQEALLGLQAFMDAAPEAFTSIGVLAHVPAMDAIPAAHHGAPCVLLVGPYLGSTAEGAEALAPLRRLATPLADLSGPMPFLEVQQFFDEDYPSGGRYYWTSSRQRRLTPDAVDRLVALNDAAPSPHATLDVWFTHGGAADRVAPDATAFGPRTPTPLLGVEANWHDESDDDANVAWARRCVREMAPFASGGSYLNFPGFAEDGAALTEAALGSTYARLQEVKRRYDPRDVFRTHQRVAVG